MTFNGAFKFYSYLLLIVSFLTLLFSGGLSIPMASLYLIAVAVSWRYQLRFLAGRFQFLVVLALILWLLVDSALLTSFMDSLIHLLLLVSLVKLFSLNSGRDYLILYLISFVFVLLASSYTLSVLFVVGLVIYLFCAILTFMLHETRKAYAENRKIAFSHRAYLQMAGARHRPDCSSLDSAVCRNPQGSVRFLRLGHTRADQPDRASPTG